MSREDSGNYSVACEESKTRGDSMESHVRIAERQEVISTPRYRSLAAVGEVTAYRTAPLAVASGPPSVARFPDADDSEAVPYSLPSKIAWITR